MKNLRNTYYKNKYNFDDDINILRSFEKIFNKYDIKYTPYKNSKNTQVQCLLNKLENNDKIDENLYNYFYKTLKEKQKLSLKIPTKNIIVQGDGLIKSNKIKIDKDLLNKNTLSIRYINGRKLTNKLLKDDYKISKNMVNALKFNKDIYKLSKNEKIFIMKFKNIRIVIKI